MSTRVIKYIWIFLLVSMVSTLTSCDTTPEEMAKIEGKDSNYCRPVANILNFENKPYIRKLMITDDNGEKVGVITWLIGSVTGVVRDASLKMYLKIALNLDFRFFVTMMLTLSVMFFTASILLGLVRLSGYNVVLFVLKLVIVYQLTINYFYFYTYVIQTFESLVTDTLTYSALTFSDHIAIDKSVLCLNLLGQICDVVGMATQALGGSNSSFATWFPNASPGSSYLFTALDDTLSHFFDYRMWQLIIAISGLGVTGIFYAIMMAVFCYLYLLSIIMVVKTYLFSYIARFALYALGPIFITLALFNQTRSLFDGWLRQLINFTLQPVFLFIMLGMFQSMITGFIGKLFVDDGGGWSSYQVQIPCASPGHCLSTGWDNTSTCPYITCTSSDPECTNCNGDLRKYYSTISSNSGSMCLSYQPITTNRAGKSNLYWYKLCRNVATDGVCVSEDMSPFMPVDIWVLLSMVVICYIMVAMCSWVTELAATMAGGVMTFNTARVPGWDRLKSSVGEGIMKAFKTPEGQSSGRNISSGGTKGRG